MALQAKEKFDAAVRVIHGLPKNGSFQPSNELMLRFYAYYKQATEGTCRKQKPSFWDVVNRAKWDAWSKLDGMEREVAMTLYVDELKQIIETMPQTHMVADFMEKLGSFYEIVDEKSPFESNAQMPQPIGDSRNPDAIDGAEANELQNDITSEVLEHSDLISNMLSSDMITDEVEAMADMQADVTETMEAPQSLISEANILLNSNYFLLEKALTQEEAASKPNMNGPLPELVPAGSKLLEKRGNSLTSESDTDGDEFCDTSDQILQGDNEEDAITNYPTEFNVSTPQHKFNIGLNSLQSRSSKANRMSPIGPIRGNMSLPPHEQFPVPRRFPFGQIPSHDQPESDSLLVNVSPQESMNNSLASELNVSRNLPGLGDFSRSDNSSAEHSFTQPDILGARGGGGADDKKGRGGAGGGRSRRGPEGSASGPGRGRQHVSHHTSRRGPLSQGGGGEGDGEPDGAPSMAFPGDINEQIAIALVRLQQDMNSVLTRLSQLENVARQQSKPSAHKRVTWASSDQWWPVPNISGRMAFFVLVWPFLVHWIINILSRRHRHKH